MVQPLLKNWIVHSKEELSGQKQTRTRMYTKLSNESSSDSSKILKEIFIFSKINTI